jgi:hypothetical protein
MADDKKSEYPRIEFRIQNKRMKKLLNERVGRLDMSTNTVARRDLERYNVLLDSVRPAFTRDQALLLVDVFNGTRFEPIEMSLSALWASLDDAEDAYYQKHGVAKKALVGRIHNLSEAEALAVIDAIERFWNSQEKTVTDVGLCGPPEKRN